MLKKIAAVIMIIIFTMGSTACSAKKKTRYEASFLGLFDTMTQIVAYSDSKELFTKYSQSIHDNLKEYNDLYDIYHDYKGINNIKTINDNAGVKPVKVDKRIIDLLQLGKDKYKSTNGKLNIAMGSVLKIWHKYREDGLNDEANAKLPPMSQLQEAARHTDINKVIIDKENSTVFLQDKDMSIDVGAIGKGYATEQVAQMAIKEGFTSGLISVGGNIRAIGTKGENNEPWNLGIQNPDKESKNTNLCTVNLSDKSLVTSGDYERYYTVNGKNYHHIIDPNTLFPANYFHSVTIICKDSGMADALSTAVFNMPFDEGLKYINSMPDTEAMWVMENGEIKYSDNFKKYIKNN